MSGLIEGCVKAVQRVEPLRPGAKVIRVEGALLEAVGPNFSLGTVCEVHVNERQRLLAEVVGASKERLSLMLLEQRPSGGSPLSRGVSEAGAAGLRVGLSVYPKSTKAAAFKLHLSERLLGQVVNFSALPLEWPSASPARSSKRPYQRLDEFSEHTAEGEQVRSIFAAPPPALERPLITTPFATGIRAIDGLLTVGEGQRLGIFSGSGVGKSTLLAMLARRSAAEVNVIALIGERGREVREFVERQLGEEGLAKSVVVVVGADEPPLAKVRGLYTATTIAEFFRDQGKSVLLLIDSLTRVALAQRNLGALLKEPPTTLGYTPSVFKLLEEVLERSGRNKHGAITAFYTVLVEGDDFDEPITDAVRGIVDGHLILRRKLANAAHYPALDLPASISRLMPEVVDKTHLQAALKVREWLAVLEEFEEVVNLGAYVSGSNPLLDTALGKRAALKAFLLQEREALAPFEATKAALQELTFSST